MPTPKGLDLAIPVWGRKYCNRLLAYALPSLFAPRNLPALARRLPTRIVFYTNAADAAFLRQRLPAAFKEQVGFGFEEIAADAAAMAARLDPAGAGAGQVMKACHNLSLAAAHGADRGWLCGWTDTIWADGFGERVLRTIDSGKRALMYSPIDAAAAIMPELRQYTDLERGVLAVPSRALATLALRGHAATAPRSIDKVRGPGAGLLWPLGERRAIHLRTPHVNVGYIHQEKLAQCEDSADDDLVDRALSSLDQIDFVEDSDEYCVLGVDEPGVNRTAGVYRSDVEPVQLAAWLRKQARPWHLDYLKRRFWFHDGTLTAAERAELDAAADAFIAQALAAYAATASLEGEDDLVLAPPRLLETLQGVGLVAFEGKVFTVPAGGSQPGPGAVMHPTLEAARAYVLAGKAGKT